VAGRHPLVIRTPVVRAMVDVAPRIFVHLRPEFTDAGCVRFPRSSSLFSGSCQVYYQRS
jgi:hypothetical protein